MIIKEKIGNLYNYPHAGRSIDRLSIQWHEAGKRILYRKSASGRDIIIKFLKEAQNLKQDDILFADDDSLIVVDIIPCEAIVIQPAGLYQMALACYEIGNKHLPLFYEDDTLVIPYERPLYTMLQAAGFDPVIETRRLSNQLRTTVSPHAHGGSGESLFSKILKLTSASE
jgi:urease accessory protein